MVCRAIGILALLVAPSAQAQETKAERFSLPPGFVIEQVAGVPLVEHPMMANFDDQGRLFIADSAGRNLKAADLLKELPNRIRVLAPADARGVFRKGDVFADSMSFPQGVLWHRGSVFTASSPSIWKLVDARGAGKADERRELVSKFGFTGNAADIHGPFLGPDGRLYWCDGRHGHDITRPDGTKMLGKAARIFRCKPDGSEVEVVCGGGMDNPVEIAFTDEGEPLVTVNILHNLPARNDGIIFAIEGGVYPWHEVFKEFARTGDLLPAVENLGWVAPSGIMRYRGDALGEGYQGNLFTAQFNRNRIQRHVLERDGAGFKVKTEDFLTSSDRNFHPTDVLEDADGSLLVVDTGGWFRIGCPTSKIAQPEIKGAIHRIRRLDAAKMHNPRGLGLTWKEARNEELAARLADPRPAVRDRAIEELAERGGAGLGTLERVLGESRSAMAVRNAVWTLTRIESDAARALVRRALADRDMSVQLAALHSVGLHRDAKALTAVETLVVDERPAVRRQAATALGRLRQPRAVSSLMAAMKMGGDGFLEHAVIHALIQINDPDSVLPYLKQPDARQQRAALIALDQMTRASLTREQVTPLLASDDAALRRTVLEVVARRPGWGSEIAGLLRDWMAVKDLDASRRNSLRDLIHGLAGDAAIQTLVAEGLAAKETSASVRVVLLESLASAPLAKLPAVWLDGLGSALQSDTPAVALQAISGIHQRGLTGFDATLATLARSGAWASVRVAAFAALDGRLRDLDAGLFTFLVSRLEGKADALERIKVARALGKSSLERDQLRALADAMGRLGPMELPLLLPAFAGAGDAATGAALLTALEKAPGRASLNPGEVGKTLAALGLLEDERGKKLVALLEEGVADQSKRIEELKPLLEGGDIDLGRNVFFGPRALCSTCHSAGGRGGNVGPDLSKIGAIRSGRDLLESVTFPSASFARGFEPWTLETKAGKVVAGLLTRETADAVVITTTDRQELRVLRDEIESLTPARASIMPQGLDAVLGRDELRHLLAYLQSLR